MNIIFKDSSDKKYYIAECENDGCFKSQASLYRPVAREPMVDQFIDDYNNHGFEYILKKYGGNNIKGKIRFAIKKFMHETGVIYLIKHN